MMNRKEMKTALETLIDCHMFSGNVTPAGTVASLVQRLGYDAAREIVALAVMSKGEWDGRISESARAWAFDLTGTTGGTLAARGFYYPDAIHPAHMEQIARAMMDYQPEPEPTEAPAPVEYTETRYLFSGDLRSLCIKMDWFTRGTVEEYERMFARLWNDNGESVHMTTEKLAEVAQDIAQHSALPDGYDIPAIMYELARICNVCFDVK